MKIITEVDKKRTEKMVKMRLSGLSFAKIGVEFGISRQRVQKILSKYIISNIKEDDKNTSAISIVQ